MILSFSWLKNFMNFNMFIEFLGSFNKNSDDLLSELILDPHEGYEKVVVSK